MKILQVIPYFVPAYSYGGPLKVCFDVSEELVRRGNEITVATTDTLDGKNRVSKLEEEIDGIHIIRFRNISNSLAKNYNGYLPIGFCSWAKNNLKNFDVVYCHDFFTLQNIIIAYFCKKYSVPFIIQPHGTLSPIRQKSKAYLLKKIFLKIFIHVLKNSKYIIALTENEKKEIISIEKSLGDKIKVIPNGLDLKEFEDIEKIDLYRKYNLPEKNKIIGYVGRIQRIKGLDISLEILANLKDKLDFTYMIVGPDEDERANLENIIKKFGLRGNVVFTGILEGKEKLETMKSWDLFLFTSRNEGLPMTILEIAALGVPQIISKNCNVPQVATSQSGFTFKLTEKDKIINAIIEILSDQELRAKFSVGAKGMIHDYFNSDLIFNSINNLLENIHEQ